jgi:hypothetical protein
VKIGTKSLLFGVHQFFIHPLFVFWGWTKLYRWPNWRELICIIIYDWGYWGCPDIDGEQGTKHSLWAGNIMYKYFKSPNIRLDTDFKVIYTTELSYLCTYHSRFYTNWRNGRSQQYKIMPSKLYWADKLGLSLYPTWLWIFLTKLTGEVDEGERMNCSTCEIRVKRLAPGHDNCRKCLAGFNNNYPGYKCNTCSGTKEICSKCIGTRKYHHTDTHTYSRKVCPDCK